MEDPGEWEAFFRKVLGRDMPQNAAYEAENYRIDAAAPPDVFGLAAEYLETHYPRGFDYDELAAERQGMSLDRLYAERYRELPASQPGPDAAATQTDAARLAGASFPGPVQTSPSPKDSSEALRRTPSSHPRPAMGQGGDLK